MKAGRATDEQIRRYIDERFAAGDLSIEEVAQIMIDLNLGGYNDM